MDAISDRFGFFSRILMRNNCKLGLHWEDRNLPWV